MAIALNLFGLSKATGPSLTARDTRYATGTANSGPKRGNDATDRSNTLVLGILFVVATFVIVFIQLGVNSEPKATWEGFIARSGQSFLSASFFVSGKPFVTDLFYKLLGGDTYRIVLAQKMLSAIAWGLLGYALARTFKYLIVGIGCLALFSLASLSWNIFGWTAVMRSESFTFSLLALWIAGLITYLRRQTTVTLGALCVVTILLNFTRDSISFLLVACSSFLLLLTALERLGERRSLLRGLLIFLALTLSLTVIQLWIAKMAERQLGPLGGVVTMRVLPDPERLNWFREKGMPVNQTLLRWSGRQFYDQVDGEHIWRSGNEILTFSLWQAGPGISQYVSYLLSHPRYLLTAPFENERRLRDVLGYDLNVYFQSPGSLVAEFVEKYGEDWEKVAKLVSAEKGLYEGDAKDSLRPGTAQRYWLGYQREKEARDGPLEFFPDVNQDKPFRFATFLWGDSKVTYVAVLMAMVPFIMFLFGLCRKTRGGIRDSIAWNIPAALVLSVLVHAVVVYHGDACEVARHSVVNGVTIRIAFFMCVLACLDVLADKALIYAASPIICVRSRS